MTDNLPERDRRHRRRFLTLRNIGVAVLVILVAFAGFSLWRELNPRSDDGTALLDSRKQNIDALVVREANPYVAPEAVDEHDPREPLWTDRPSQEEILGVDPYEPYRQRARAEMTTTPTDPINPPTPEREPAVSFRGSGEPFAEQRTGTDGARIKITGAGTDVRLEKPDDPPER